MPKVKLAVAARLPGYPLRPAGYVLDVDEDIYSTFADRGFFADNTDEGTTPPAPTPAEPAEDNGDEAPQETKRPAKTASIDTWRDYAESEGINPKGMSKQEIIAATR